MPENLSTIKRKSLTGFIWRMGEGVIAQGMTFIVGMFLARLLEPEEFGIVALSGIFLSIIGVFANCGLGQALIQKKDADSLDTNSVFFAGLGIAGFLYLFVFLGAPLVAQMFHQPAITNLMRVSSLTLFLSSYNSVQIAEVSRALDFKKFFFVGIISSFVSGFVGLSMAFYGFGVWALVSQSIAYSIAKTIVMSRIIGWTPKLQFSWGRLKPLLSYGLNLMIAGVIGMIFHQMRGFLIGLKYKPTDLSFYSRGESMPNILCNNINGTIEQIMLPALSKVQDTSELVKVGLRHSIMLSSFVLMPMMFGLAATAENIIPILFSEKWMPSVPFLQVIAIGYCFSILSSTNLMAINAIGRSDITLKLEYIKKPSYLVLLLLAILWGPLAIAAATAIYSIIAMSINAWPNKKLINYSLREQWEDLWPQFVLSLVMGIIVWLVGRLDLNIYILFFIQMVLGVVLYLGLSKLLHLEGYKYALKTWKDLRRGNND